VADQKPKYDRDEVITRLIAEQTQTSRILEECRIALASDQEFQGLSLPGGIKTIIRRYKEEQEKNLQLERELTQMMRAGKSRPGR